MKFAAFETPLNNAIAVITEYYDKTAISNAFIVAMRQFHSQLSTCSTYLILTPEQFFIPK
jgi:hypothetical protein